MTHRPTLSLDVNSSRPTHDARVGGPQSAVMAGQRSAIGPSGPAGRTMRPPSPALATPMDAPALSFAMQSIFEHLHDVRALQSALVKDHIALEGVGSTTWPAATPADGRDDGRRATAEAYTALKEEFTARQKGVERVMGRLDELATALRSFDRTPEHLLAQPVTPRHRSTTVPSSPEGGPRARAVTPP